MEKRASKVGGEWLIELDGNAPWNLRHTATHSERCACRTEEDECYPCRGPLCLREDSPEALALLIDEVEADLLEPRGEAAVREAIAELDLEIAEAVQNLG